MGTSIDTTATLFITLFVFITGVIINRIFEFLKGQRKRANLRKTIDYAFRSLADGVELQAEEFIKYVNSLKKKNNESFVFNQITIPHIFTIKSIPFLDVYNALVNYRLLNRNKKIQAFDNLFKKLSLIDNINTNYPEDFKLLMQKLNEYLSHWNNSVEAIRKHFDEIAMNYSGKGGLSQELVLFLQDFDQLMLGIQKFKNDLTLFDEYEYLIKPLDNIIKKHNKIPLILPLINHRLEAILAYENYNNLINAYADKFEDNSKKFSEASEIIRSALNDLK